MKDKILLIESHHFPSIEFFVLLQDYPVIRFEVCENFQKQTYRNRCNILGANKVQKLVVPVVHEEDMRMEKVRIAYRQDWLKDHWRSIVSAYNRSPYFEHYKTELEEIFKTQPDRLLDLNLKLLSFCLEKLGWTREIEFTDSYEHTIENPSLEDMRGVLDAKRDFRERHFMRPVPYYQLFGKGFVPNLSIIDLLFCEGPLSGNIIQSSRGTPNK